MADLEKVSAQIEGIEARIVKALDAGEKVLEFDKQLKEAREEQAVALKAAHDVGAKISEELSKRIEAQERRLGALSATGAAEAPAQTTEKSFGAQITDWLSDPNIADRARNGRGTNRFALKGARLRDHYAASEYLKSKSIVASDENMRKAMLLSDVTNFAPVNRLPDFFPAHGRRRVLSDLIPTRNLPIGSTWQYLEWMGLAPSTYLTATSVASTGTTATLTYTAHGCRVGDRIHVKDSSDTEYNGYFFVETVPTADTLTYTMASDAVDDTADGTILWANLSTYGAAATVAENQAKPESVLPARTVDGVVELMAHIFRVTKQALDDVANLQNQINSNGISGLQDLLEWKLLHGTGASSTITGFLQAAGTQAYTQAVAGSVGRFAMFRRGVTLLENVGAVPSGAIINPYDRETFDMSVGLDDHLMLPAGLDGGTQSIFRVPLVSSRWIAPGTILMGDFSGGAEIVERESPQVSFADQDGNDFTYNRVAMRFEQRAGLAIPKPEFFAKLTLS